MKNIINTIPNKPGVYLMKDKENKVIYVGKAKRLKSRVSSYFNNNNHALWTKIMITQIDDIEYFVTKNEFEALLLENTLIKKYKTPFNIKMRDDKTFPYIKFSNDKFPRMSIVRKIIDDKAIYIGPYLSTREMNSNIRLIQSMLGIVTHSYKIGQRPCLNYQLGLCAAPYAGKIGESEYQNNIQQAIKFLQGNISEVVIDVRKRMEEASQKMAYEEANKWKYHLQSLESLLISQNVQKSTRDCYDIWATSKAYSQACVSLVKMRVGKIIENRNFIFNTPLDNNESEITLSAMINYYLSTNDIPKTIFTQQQFNQDHLLLEMFKSKNNIVKILRPFKGNKYDLLLMAKENADTHLDSELASSNIIKSALLETQKSLQLDRLPRRIEAFDISNLGSHNPVGAMVTFIDGIPYKDHYRKFKIKYTKGQNDTAMMAEIVKRRLSNRLLPKPNLILIDGGVGQLNAVNKVLEDFSTSKIELISIAKKFEIIYKSTQYEPIILPRDNKSLLLIERIRDEVHRFAVAYHRKRRAINNPK